MGVSLRQYDSDDFKPVSDFLIANYQPGNRDGNWLQPAWVYMHYHPSLDESSLDSIGMWESAWGIVRLSRWKLQGVGDNTRRRRGGRVEKIRTTACLPAPQQEADIRRDILEDNRIRR